MIHENFIESWNFDLILYKQMKIYQYFDLMSSDGN